MALNLYRPDLGRWVNQEVCANIPGPTPDQLLLINILIELRTITQFMSNEQHPLTPDDPQAMRQEIAINVPLNAF